MDGRGYLYRSRHCRCITGGNNNLYGDRNNSRMYRNCYLNCDRNAIADSKR